MKPRTLTREQLKSEGLVIVGEWGWDRWNERGEQDAGHIVCRSEDLPVVKAAYDAIDDDDLGYPDVLDEVLKSGGEYVWGLYRPSAPKSEYDVDTESL